MQRVIIGLGICLFAQPAFAHERDSEARHSHPTRSAVFTVSNEAEGNRVFAFAAERDGSLGEPRAFATGGRGTGDSLGSQGALALSDDHRFLIAVDAGSNEITAFAVNGATLEVTDRASSGGTRPISVTTRDGLVYVVNAGVPNTVQGFSLDRHGKLTPLRNAVPLSTDDAGPAQIELTSDGERLVVAEKTANELTLFRVGSFGRLSAPVVNESAGMTPFGFELTTDDTLVVSEAASGSLSSYEITRRGALDTLSAAVSDTQQAPCWVAISNDDRVAFTANAGSASISSYRLDRDGHLALLDARAGDLGEGGTPLDLAFDDAGHRLYALDRGHSEIVVFKLGRAGALTRASDAGGLPPFSTGLAAY
jgi:6-phosphogluconolactonase (cycloisomerase 2 family)